MAKGNTAYWYCDGCSKYYSDEAGTKTITLEDTIIPKLSEHTAENSDTDSPQTGDSSNLALPIILLFVSGIGLVETIIYLRKRRYSK